jgi:Ca2+-binding EF-hand superfamily protein
MEKQLEEYEATVSALQSELQLCEAGSAEYDEMATILDTLTGEMAALQKKTEKRNARKLKAVGKLLVVGENAKTNKKKKKKKKKEKSFFDDSYMRKQETDVKVRLLITAGDNVMKIGEAGTEGDWLEAMSKFEEALECDSKNIRARVGLTKATKLLAAERARLKQAQKVELMQKRYGENWAQALIMETETPSEGALREVFELIDADASGLLDRGEVVSLIDFFSDTPMTDKQVDTAMAEMDADGSGEVDFDEFAVWFKGWDKGKDARDAKEAEDAKPKAGPSVFEKPVVVKTFQRTGAVDVDDEQFTERLRQIFNRYDDDGSGEIDAAELGQIMASMGKPMAEAEVAAMINEIDDSGDGLIDFQEFCSLIRGEGRGSEISKLLREQTFGAMDAEEKYMWARGRILRFGNGLFAPVFSRVEYDKAISQGAHEPLQADNFV